MKFKPLIGITTGYDYNKNNLYLNQGYFEGIYQSGGIAIAIPPTMDGAILSEFINLCDGFLISGGPDVDGKHYGEGNMPCNGDISPLRDFAELYLIKQAIEKDLPLLGICRGIQVMNVAMGGTLYQDIYTQNKEKSLLQHSQHAPTGYPTHDILIESQSWVWKSFQKKETGRVNTFHHQAVKDLGAGFEVTARATDGIIEAIERKNSRFSVGVQWHPELMWQDNREFLNLFGCFVEEAAREGT